MTSYVLFYLSPLGVESRPLSPPLTAESRRYRAIRDYPRFAPSFSAFLSESLPSPRREGKSIPSRPFTLVASLVPSALGCPFGSYRRLRCITGTSIVPPHIDLMEVLVVMCFTGAGYTVPSNSTADASYA